MPERPLSLLRRRGFHLGVLSAAAALAVPAVRAQAWPARPIRLVVPYPPGGFTDVTARMIAQKLQERLGQPVVVENKPGANSIIGTDALAKAAPDGYTFGLVIAAFAANSSLYPRLPYDPAKDFAPVSLAGISPLIAGVSADAPFKTPRELIEYARRHPGKVSFGSSGNGSAAHLTTELFKARTATYMVHIPYRGAAAALSDLMGGQIQLLFDAASGLIPHGKAGKIRLIGVASEQRLPAIPELPTFIEQGVPGFTGSTWAGLLAPRGTPAELIARMSGEVARIVRSDETRGRLEGMGTIPVGNSPAEFERFLADETAKWGGVIRHAKVTAD